MFKKPIKKEHPFDALCRENHIKHKLIQFFHPWTNGQVERFNGTMKSSTTKKYFYTSMEQLQSHLDMFINAYNYAKRLRSLKYLTPHQKLLEYYKKNVMLFKRDPVKDVLGLDNY